MPVTLKSRFPQIVAELKPRVDLALKEAAEMIAEDAKQRVPVDTGALRDAIHVERDGVAEYRVVAGDDEAFYGHMVEFGTTNTPTGMKRRHRALTDEQRASRATRTAPRPFLVPAAEAHRAEVEALGAAALKHL